MKEIMEALLDGKKICDEAWCEDEYICFNDKGIMVDECDQEMSIEGVVYSDNMYIYEEPKEKVELFIWALADNKDCYYSICTNFMTEEEAKLVHGGDVIKTNISIVVEV